MNGKDVSVITSKPAVLVLCLVVAICACSKPSADPAPPEHLFLVVFDTLRADRMSLYGHDLPTTPFLEQVGARSVVFERFKAVAP